jgi:putative transposase
MRTEHQAKLASWELPDEVWQRMEPLIPPRKSKVGHPRPVALRRITEGIFFVLRTGMPWQAVPRERFAAMTTSRGWNGLGTEHRWSDDQGSLGEKATGPHPTDRGKKGTKRSLLTEGQGVSIGLVVAGANCHDKKLLADTLEAVVVERPEPSEEEPQHLCGDKGYDYPDTRQEAADHQHLPHIRSRRAEPEERRDEPEYRPRRWVVAVGHSWLKRFRKILVGFEKKLATHLALLQFAGAYIVLKRAGSF